MSKLGKQEYERTASEMDGMKADDKEKSLWAAIVNDIRRRGDVGMYGLENYICKLTLKEDTGTKLVLEYPADLPIMWLEINYKECIANSAACVMQAAREIELVPRAGDEKPAAEPTDQQGTCLPLVFGGDAEAQSPEQVETRATPPKRKSVRKTDSFNSGLNEEYDFSSFVVGDNSEFAYAAAVATAQQPGKFNPLFIHGSSGLGKTHLLQAIGNAMRKENDEARVLYATGETFTNSYIDALAIKGDAVRNFRRKFRKADVLLIDDVQFLAHKGKTQEEFFYTFNTLFESGKQIVLTADCPAADIIDFEERLKSRFEQGLSVALRAPSYETRMAILRAKRCRKRSELLSDEVLDFLAKSITRSVRRLEGALTRLATFASFSHRRPTVQEARSQLREFMYEEPAARLAIKDIQQCVADEFHLRVSDLNGRRRTANIAQPRQIAMFLARQHTACSLQDIGAAFGGRDHGTVIHASRTIEQRLTDQPELRESVGRIMAALGI